MKMEILQMIWSMAVQKLPILGIITANTMALLLAVNIVIEAVEAVAALTTSKADDEAVKKIKAIKDKVIAVLEFLPHTNVPLTAGVIVATKWLVKGGKVLAAAVKAWKE
jgi:hypothetical protein